MNNIKIFKKKTFNKVVKILDHLIYYFINKNKNGRNFLR